MPDKKLYRSRNDRIIAGVCGGLADYFDIDVTLVRLIFVVLTIINGLGLIIYIIMAIITPVADRPDNGPRDNFNELATAVKNKTQAISADIKDGHIGPQTTKLRFWLGLIIAAVGIAMLINNFIPFALAWFFIDLATPLIIIVIGIYFISKK